MPVTVGGQLRLMFHRMTFLAFGFAVYYDKYYTFPPHGSSQAIAQKMIGGRAKYLTYQSLLFHTFYFCLAMVNDISGTNEVESKKQSKSQKFRDFMFTTLIFPLGVFVCTIFWGLYAVDRKLIHPIEMDSWFPSWLNHLMHTLPVAASLVEALTIYHTYVNGFKKFIPILTYFAAYLLWILYVAYVHNHWIYPVFEVLDPVSRVIFFIFLVFPPISFIFLGQKLQAMIWGKQKTD